MTSKWNVSKYGLLPGEYLAMEQNQFGRCAICGQTPKRGLVVDHDHETGDVRGLLCFSCNSGLGFFRDNIRLLAGAIVYLEDCTKSRRSYSRL